MARPVVWAESALSELEQAIAYIASRDPAAARRVLSEIRAAGDRLGKRPIGRTGRVPGTFEKSVVSRPYIIAYAIDHTPEGSERLVILRVIHTARDWPSGQWPK